MTKRRDILSMDETAYRMAEGVANSDLEYIIPPYTPAHYKGQKELPPPPPTKEQKLGTLTHRALLEPDSMKEGVAIAPAGMKFNKKDGKKWLAEHEGFTVIKYEEYQDILGMMKSVRNHPIAKKFLDNGKKEQCVFAHDSSGLLRKARIDIIPDSGNTLPDVKTCRAGDLDSFNKNIMNFGYHRQSAYYLDIMKLIGREFENFVFICVETFYPYLVVCYPIDILSLEIGQKEYQGALARLRLCQDQNYWPGYPETLDTFCGLPMWSKQMREGAS